jgi:putative transposase
VISDARGGIKAAIETVLSGSSWQRCRTHFMANFAGRVPKASWPMVATRVRSVFEQPERDAVRERLGDVASKLTETGFVDAATYLLDAADDVFVFSAFPVEHWPKIRSINPALPQ